MAFKGTAVYRQRNTIIFLALVGQALALLATHGEARAPCAEDLLIRTGPDEGGQISCDNSNLASVSSCNVIINQLNGKAGSTVLATSPRRICYQESGNQCCLSWGKDAPGLTKSSLYDSANAILNKCQNNAVVSGTQGAVPLTSNVYAIVCLSNREGSCTGGQS